MWGGFELRIQYSIKNSQIYYERVDNKVILYYSIPNPPKIFVSYNEINKFQNRLVRDNINWKHIPNVFLENMGDTQYFKSELLRLHKVNNSVIKCVFDSKICTEKDFMNYIDQLKTMDILKASEDMNAYYKVFQLLLSIV